MTTSPGTFVKDAVWYDPRTWFSGAAKPAAPAATAPAPYQPSMDTMQRHYQLQRQQEDLGKQLQQRRAAGQPTDDLLSQMGQMSHDYSASTAAMTGRNTYHPRTPEQMANMAANYQTAGLPVPKQFTPEGVPGPAWTPNVAQRYYAASGTPQPAPYKPLQMPSNNQNWLTAGVPMKPPAPVPGVAGVTAKPPVPIAAKSQAPRAPGMAKLNKATTWYGVVKQAIAPSMAELQATSQSLKSRLEGITHDRVQGNAEMNARLDQANKALDSTSGSPKIGPDTPYVHGAGQAALFENQHNVPPPPLTYGQLERQADVAGAGSGRLTEAGNLGLTMPGRGERINPVEERSKDPRIDGARIVEALKASKRMNLPFTVEHFLNGYVNPETVLHEDAKRGIPARKAPTMALPYANIPFAGR